MSAFGFELQGVSARWIDNAVAGRVFVVTGKIKRSEGTTPWNVTPLAVRLLDARGKALDLPLTAIGPQIPDDYLRSTSPTDLVEMQRGRAGQFAAFAGTWLQFDAVIPEIPTRAERFEFSPIVLDVARPSLWRSSLKSPTPCARRARGVAGPSNTPTRMLPCRTGSSPKTARTISVRPAPMSPAMPSTSPR